MQATKKLNEKMRVEENGPGKKRRRKGKRRMMKPKLLRMHEELYHVKEETQGKPPVTRKWRRCPRE